MPWPSPPVVPRTPAASPLLCRAGRRKLLTSLNDDPGFEPLVGARARAPWPGGRQGSEANGMHDNERFDVAILGAGLGRTMLAAILARQGRRVLLLEKGSHPRFA